MQTQETREFNGVVRAHDGYFASVIHLDEQMEHWYGPFDSDTEATEVGLEIVKKGPNTTVR